MAAVPMTPQLDAMTMQERCEALGRMSMWEGALENTIELLEMAIRARADAQQRIAASNESPDFPTTWEALRIGDQLPMLAAVVFASIYNEGFKSPWKALKNTTPGAGTLRASIERSAFPDAAEFASFIALRDKVQEIRNTTIAHNDAASFNIKVYAVGMPALPATAGLSSIDVHEWLSYVKRLKYSMSKHRIALATAKEADWRQWSGWGKG